MTFLWDQPGDLDGNLRHVEKHGVTAAEVEEILLDPTNMTTTSRSSGRPITFGYTMKGRYLAVVWEMLGRHIRPITAYNVPKPGKRRRRR